MKIVLVMFKDEERREFPLKPGATVLGRARDCDLRIPTRDTSRRHCEIIVSEKGAIIRDLNSSNGTMVNGQRVAEHVLKAGDKIGLGPVSFIVQIDGKPEHIHAADAAPLLEDADASAVTAVELERGDSSSGDVLDLDELDLELDDLDLELDDDEDDDKPAKPKRP